MTVFNFQSTADIDQSFITFHDQVFERQPFVLIVVAPLWCGHCKAMQNDLDSFLALEQKAQGNVVVVTDEVMNHLVSQHAENKVSQTLRSVVSGFPSIAFVEPSQGNEINVHEMDEPRTQEGLKTFKDKNMQRIKSQMKKALANKVKAKSASPKSASPKSASPKSASPKSASPKPKSKKSKSSTGK